MNDSPCPVESLMQLLHSVSPYDNFPLTEYKKDLSGWHSDSPVIGRVLSEFKPSLIVEVGSWLGASAIEMAQYIKKESPGGRILCVDTWLGGAEFWMDHTDDRYKGLRLKNGYPQVYYQFLANVLLCGAEDVIVPFPQTSLNAACWMRKNDVKADIVYVDASHEEMDVYEDLKAYWPMIRPGGVLFGDDYDDYWPGVVLAVNRFAGAHKLKVMADTGFWIIRKPEGKAETGDAPGDAGDGDIAELRAENTAWRNRVISIQKDVAEMEVRAGFFYTQMDPLKAELEKLKAENGELRAELNASRAREKA